MRLVRFGGAMSLDGWIAGPNGEYDWIQTDPEMDFAEMMAEFDTFLIGRRTFEMMAKQGMTAEPAGATYIVCSRTMREADWPGLHISRDAATTVAGLKASSGRDIAVFGGGDLFRSLLAAGLVDRVEVSVVPVLLGGGVPLLPSPADRARLKLRSHRLYGTTGTMRLEYDILPASPA